MDPISNQEKNVTLKKIIELKDPNQDIIIGGDDKGNIILYNPKD